MPAGKKILTKRSATLHGLFPHRLPCNVDQPGRRARHASPRAIITLTLHYPQAVSYVRPAPSAATAPRLDRMKETSPADCNLYYNGNAAGTRICGKTAIARLLGRILARKPHPFVVASDPSAPWRGKGPRSRPMAVCQPIPGATRLLRSAGVFRPMGPPPGAAKESGSQFPSGARCGFPRLDITVANEPLVVVAGPSLPSNLCGGPANRNIRFGLLGRLRRAPQESSFEYNAPGQIDNIGHRGRAANISGQAVDASCHFPFS